MLLNIQTSLRHVISRFESADAFLVLLTDFFKVKYFLNQRGYKESFVVAHPLLGKISGVVLVTHVVDLHQFYDTKENYYMKEDYYMKDYMRTARRTTT